MPLPRPNHLFSTTLANAVDNSQTTMQLNALPSVVPCILTLEPKTENEEKVLVTTLGVGQITVVRGYGGTSAVAHNIGAAIADFNAPEYIDVLADAIDPEHNTDGTHKDITAESLTLDGTTEVTEILDEDDMASDSATALATQQSIKQYVDDSVQSGIFTPSSFAHQGFLLNGQFVASVAGNNLTVAIKTMAGNDPSPDDPVYIRIDNTVRMITAALSVTKNAGTNWFDSGGAELATNEVDYFVYLGYNATDGVVLGFARIPWATRYGDFSTSTTAAAYAAISTITNADSNDAYENIGRFAATLSAGAGYTWSVPSFTPINLIQAPTFETRWLTWTPVHTGFSSGPTGAVTKYKLRGSRGTGEMLCFHTLGSGGTSNSTAWTMTLPYPIPKQGWFIGNVRDNSGSYVIGVFTSNAASKTMNFHAGVGLGNNFTASGNKNAAFQETVFQLV